MEEHISSNDLGVGHNEAEGEMVCTGDLGMNSYGFVLVPVPVFAQNQTFVPYPFPPYATFMDQASAFAAQSMPTTPMVINVDNSSASTLNAEKTLNPVAERESKHQGGQDLRDGIVQASSPANCFMPNQANCYRLDQFSALHNHASLIGGYEQYTMPGFYNFPAFSSFPTFANFQTPTPVSQEASHGRELDNLQNSNNIRKSDDSRLFDDNLEKITNKPDCSSIAHEDPSYVGLKCFTDDDISGLKKARERDKQLGNKKDDDLESERPVEGVKFSIENGKLKNKNEKNKNEERGAKESQIDINDTRINVNTFGASLVEKNIMRKNPLESVDFQVASGIGRNKSVRDRCDLGDGRLDNELNSDTNDECFKVKFCLTFNSDNTIRTISIDPIGYNKIGVDKRYKRDELQSTYKIQNIDLIGGKNAEDFVNKETKEPVTNKEFNIPETSPIDGDKVTAIHISQKLKGKVFYNLGGERFVYHGQNATDLLNMLQESKVDVELSPDRRYVCNYFIKGENARQCGMKSGSFMQVLQHVRSQHQW